MFTFDTSDRARAGKPRTREWTAVAQTELDVVREMARCLREINEGRWPSWPCGVGSRGGFD
jgi:hypothetical protein